MLSLDIASLSEGAFFELVRHVVLGEWSGQSGDGSEGLFACQLPSSQPSIVPAGSWYVIPIAGDIPVMTGPEATQWLAARIFQQFEKSAILDRARTRPLPLLIFTASQVLSSVTGSRLSVELERLAGISWTLIPRMIGPDAIRTVADESAAITRAFQAADSRGLSLQALVTSTLRSTSRGSKAAIGSASRQLLRSAQISLTQAGGAGDEDAPLARVFLDPEAAPWPIGAETGNIWTCATIVREIDSPMLGHSIDQHRFRLVLVGGPGQGKSTAIQFLAQLYRASFLALVPEKSAAVGDAIGQIMDRAATLKIPKPQLRRWPIHVSLARYAEYLARHRIDALEGVGHDRELLDKGGLLAYMLSKELSLEGAPVGTTPFRAWLKEWPTVVLLDGMDETPPELRSDILSQIEDFEEVAAQMGADVAIVVTSRPQGEVTDFPSSSWKHFKLVELNEDQALNYAHEIIALRHDLQGEDGLELVGRMEQTISAPATTRLARTPLQVTILTLLLQENLRAQSRFQLFDGYFTVVFRREAGKPGALGEFIGAHRQVLEEVHERAAFVLQLRSERGSDSSLSDAELQQLLSGVLESRGYRPDAVLSARLRSAIVDRLVLLVSPRETQWHFEVRVLQEYMTARHWTSGNSFSPEHLARVLARAASLPFWRTVWSLSAGRVLADRVMYRPLLLTAIAQANAVDSVAISTHPASRLSLELLLDDAAADRPIDARMLLSLVLNDLQDFPLDSVSGLVEVLAVLLPADTATDQLFNDHVNKVGKAWSLERVALTALLRALRVQSHERPGMTSRVDGWLKIVGNVDDRIVASPVLQDVSLELALRTADSKIPRAPGFPAGLRYTLSWDDPSGFLLGSSTDLRVAISHSIVDAPTAEWLAGAESRLRSSSQRLAKQLRDGLSYWAGLKILPMEYDSMGNPVDAAADGSTPVATSVL